jgi:hypothetical protein
MLVRGVVQALGFHRDIPLCEELHDTTGVASISRRRKIESSVSANLMM